ncbi:MAG: LytR C-terminal domain-containing protein [Gemmatimonadales bacterium]
MTVAQKLAQKLLSAAVRHWRTLLGLAAAGTAAVLLVVWFQRGRAEGFRRTGVTVEVLNASWNDGAARSGLARQVTRLLRDRGVDVLYLGSVPRTAGVDSTTVLTRRGDPGKCRDVARILAVTKVVDRPDSSRRVDCTVLAGPDFRFPKGWLPL